MNQFKLLFALLPLLLASIGHGQSYGNIQGKIVTSNNTPAEYINVRLLELENSTVTDDLGHFILKQIIPGDYTLQYSLVGLETNEIDVTVDAGETLDLNTITLDENKVTLDAMVINARRINQFAEKKSAYVSRLPLENIKTPQSYTIVTDELINEQLSTDLPSSLKSITGGGYIEANTGAVSLYARGFRNDARVKNGLLLNTRARVVIDHQNIEQIEVIKGPSAVNYGSGFYGGLINLVTKKPLKEDKLDLAYNLGSFGLHRITADYNKPLGEDFAVRVNAAYHTENGFQDKGSEIRKHIFVAPSISYTPSDKLNVTISAEFLDGERNLNFARSFGKDVSVSSWSDLAWDYDNSYTHKDVASDMGYTLLQGEANYTFNQHWTSKTSVSHQSFEAEGPYIRLVALSNTKFARQYLGFDPEKGGANNIRQDFVGKYNFDNVQNKTLIGASYYNQYWNYTQLRAGNGGFFTMIDSFDVSNNPVIQDLSINLLDNLNTAPYIIRTGSQILSGYINHATTFQDKITVLAGIRYDDFDNDASRTNGVEGKDGYNQGKFSYNVGFTYNPIGKRMAIFANYMNGYRNQGAGTSESGDVINFDPEEAVQWEAGLKFNLFNHKLQSTLSYYNIDIDNAVLSYRTPIMSYNTQDGKIESKGFEIDIIANPFPGLNVVAGYTYNDAKNIKYSNPSAEGKRLDLTPQTVANIWASYKIIQGNLQGLGLGLGANHMSKIYAARNVTNTFWAEPYTTLDGTIFYQRPQYRIGVKVNNITNEEYYNAYGIPQKTTNFVLNLTYSM